MGHARALLALDGARQIEAANRIVAQGLSVRETEALVSATGSAARRPRAQAARPTATSRGWRRKSRSAWAPRCRSSPARKGSGTIVVRYSGLDHLDQLLKKLR